MSESSAATSHPKSRVTPSAERLADDLLYGAQAIADELGISRRAAFYGLANGSIPATRLGRIWVCSRQRLKLHFAGDDAAQ